MNTFASLLQVSLPNPTNGASTSEIQSVLDIIFAITGAIALLIITIAGFRYITSRGNPQQTAQAKDAIIYAGIGLAVSMLAYAIVGFVIGQV
jgi:multisubunit Na+/H+ antiporter MnhB subunit